MCWSIRTDRAIAAAFLIAGAGQDAGAVTPFPLAPCRIGEQIIGANTPLARARLIDGATGEPARRQLCVMEGGELLLTVTYYSRARPAAGVDPVPVTAFPVDAKSRAGFEAGSTGAQGRAVDDQS